MVTEVGSVSIDNSADNEDKGELTNFSFVLKISVHLLPNQRFFQKP